MAERTLVTGALGCIGAWTMRALLERGEEPVGYDAGSDPHRLRLVLGDSELARCALVQGDIVDPETLGRTLDEHCITHVVHLAALQVPFCRADPELGARVNVLGTVAVFKAVKARPRITGLAYASSVAVYSSADPSPAPETGGGPPRTLYGVYKAANEGTARVFWEDDEVASIGIRPYVVYGPGRDQGMTSGPTLAMRAAARGEDFTIGFAGSAQFDYAPDLAEAFVRASRAPLEGAQVANYPGVPASVEEVVAAIENAAPESTGKITWSEPPLPFPSQLESVELVRLIGELPRTPLADGVHRTVEHFRSQRQLADP